VSKTTPARAGARLIVATLLIAVSSFALPAKEDFPPEWIERGDAAFAERFEQERMIEAIAAYEAVLPGIESLTIEAQAHLLNRLAQLHYELTTFTPGNTQEDESVFQKGKEYGFASLRLNPEFAALEEDDFDAAVAAVTDPAALLWTADNWGALLDYNPISGFLYLGRAGPSTRDASPSTRRTGAQVRTTPSVRC